MHYRKTSFSKYIRRKPKIIPDHRWSLFFTCQTPELDLMFESPGFLTCQTPEDEIKSCLSHLVGISERKFISNQMFENAIKRSIFKYIFHKYIIRSMLTKELNTKLNTCFNHQGTMFKRKRKWKKLSFEITYPSFFFLKRDLTPFFAYWLFYSTVCTTESYRVLVIIHYTIICN